MRFADWKDTIIKDVLYALRQFIRNPVFTIVAITSLAFGISAHTAIFSILNQVLWPSLPVPDPHQPVLHTTPTASRVAVGMLPRERRFLSDDDIVLFRD